jgi:hypothetical protein
MIGTFNYRENCSIPHFIPQGESNNGFPVIVFPKKNTDIVIGNTYEFMVQMTMKATYTIDGNIYRVGHAVAPREVTGTEGDDIDAIMHRPSKDSSATIGNVLDPSTTEKLLALKASLST